jgi:hypothetical protein
MKIGQTNENMASKMFKDIQTHSKEFEQAIDEQAERL